VLAYFRSQHDNQSWIASLTAILDTCALVLVGIRRRVANAKPNSPFCDRSPRPSSISRKVLALLLALFFETVFPLPIFFASATPSRSTASNLTTEKLPTAA